MVTISASAWIEKVKNGGYLSICMNRKGKKWWLFQHLHENTRQNYVCMLGTVFEKTCPDRLIITSGQDKFLYFALNQSARKRRLSAHCRVITFIVLNCHFDKRIFWYLNLCGINFFNLQLLTSIHDNRCWENSKMAYGLSNDPTSFFVRQMSGSVPFSRTWPEVLLSSQFGWDRGKYIQACQIAEISAIWWRYRCQFMVQIKDN